MQNINVRINEIDTEIAEIENLSEKLGGGWVSHRQGDPGPLLSDVLNVRIGKANLKTTKANLEITKLNLEASQRLIQSIESFDKSSTTLSKWMLYLTIIIALLTAIMTLLVIVQIKDTPAFEWLYQRLSFSNYTKLEARMEIPEGAEDEKEIINDSNAHNDIKEDMSNSNDKESHFTNNVDRSIKNGEN